ncbi:MAG: ABC transporter ATP-binding protein [Rhodobacteraceae bacterium]|nr:ABC transporter ATP-binding protein [Paracoccaceae bacterium]
MSEAAHTHTAPGAASATMLSVRDLNAWYGESHVLHGVTFDVPPGKVISIVGRNGAGKTTTLRAIVGLLKKRTGSIVVEGTETIGLKPRQITRLGIGYVPEERGIFSSLSVRENFTLPRVVRPPIMDRDEIFTLFPNLAHRLNAPGTKLSGGEQQMLTMARILRTGAPLLLLDEPTEGLAPVIIEQIGETIRRLRDKGFTIVLVEQNIPFAWSLTDTFHVIEQGRVVDSIATGHGQTDAIGRLKSYLGV